MSASVRVAVLAAESSGGRLLTRWLAQQPALTVRHWSMPHGSGPERRWPTDTGEIDEWAPQAAVWLIRSMAAQTRSAAEHHVETLALAQLQAREAHLRIAAWLTRASILWHQVTYEALIGHPHLVASDLAAALRVELPGPPEPLVDANAKWETRT